MRVAEAIEKHGRQLDYTLSFPVRYSFEQNRDVQFSANQFFGKGSDILGSDFELDNNPSARILLFSFDSYRNWAITYYSHEFAHNQIQRNYDIGTEWRINWSEWNLLVPALEKENEDRKSIQGGFTWSNIHGLVQQKLNARKQYEHDVTAGVFGYDEGITYFFNTIADQAYIATDRTTVAKQALKKSGGRTGNGDIANHIGATNGRLSRTEWFLTSLGSTILSYHTFESILAMTEYLSHGKRVRNVASLSFGNTIVVPPNFQTIPHPEGLYLEESLPVNNLLGSGEWVFFDLGMITQAYGYRAGFSAKELNPIGENKWYLPTFDLAAYVSVRQLDGFSLSGGLNFKPVGKIILSLSANHSTNDIFQNEIMGKGKKHVKIGRIMPPVSTKKRNGSMSTQTPQPYLVERTVTHPASTELFLSISMNY